MTTAPAHNDAALIAAVQRILDDDPRTEAQMLSEQVATLTRQLADALQQRDAAARTPDDGRHGRTHSANGSQAHGWG